MPAHMTVRGASPKPQKGSGAREKARRARAKAKGWKAVCEAVAVRDGDRCRVCRADNLRWMWVMDFHHIVFRSQGGKDETGNVVLLCRFCHDLVHARRLVISGNADGKLTIERAA